MHFSFAYFIDSMLAQARTLALTHINPAQFAYAQFYSVLTFYLSYLCGVLHKIVLLFFSAYFWLSASSVCMSALCSGRTEVDLMLFTRPFASKLVFVRCIFFWSSHCTCFTFADNFDLNIWNGRNTIVQIGVVVAPHWPNWIVCVCVCVCVGIDVAASNSWC